MDMEGKEGGRERLYKEDLESFQKMGKVLALRLPWELEMQASHHPHLPCLG